MSAGTAVDLLAPQRRHDAEGAAVVAADGDGNPSGIGGFAGAGQRRGELLQRLGDLHLRNLVVPGPFQQRWQRSDVVRAENDVDPRRLAQHAVPVLLGQATAHRNLHVGVAALARRQVAEVAVQLVVGVFPDGAGVEDHHVRVGVVGGPPVAGRFQQAGQPLGIVHVHLAAVRAHLVGAHRRAAPAKSRGHGTAARSQRINPQVVAG